MAVVVGIAGFSSRPVRDDDPLVCVCAATIGTQTLSKPENAAALKEVRRQHQHVCRERLAHQVKHRSPVTDCEECHA